MFNTGDKTLTVFVTEKNKLLQMVTVQMWNAIKLQNNVDLGGKVQW